MNEITSNPGLDLINQRGMARLFDALPAMVILAGAEGDALFVNHETLAYTGLSREELAGDTFTSTGPIERLEPALQRVASAVTTGVPFENLHMVRRADGVLRWHLVRQMPIAGENGAICYLASTAVDVDDLVRERDDLLEANRKKDELLGMVAHELRNPLTTILASARRLAVEGRVAPGESETVAFLQQDTLRLKTLVDNMLVLARPAEDPELEPVMLQHLLPDIVGMHRTRFPGRQVGLDVALDLPIVHAHPGWASQIMENFLSNAEKYCPPGVPITVRATVAPEGVAVRVIDRGPGFPPEHAEQLFDAFFREDATSHSAAGNGLGLAVCRRLAELQGGAVWAASTPGGGAEFGFSVPIEPQAP